MIVDSGSTVYTNTRIRFAFPVKTPSGEPYPLAGKTVRATIAREEFPSEKLVNNELGTVEGSTAVFVLEKQNNNLPAPLDPTREWSHLIQFVVEEDEYPTDIVRFGVSRMLREEQTSE